jgi:hypothetical protein
MLGDGLLQPRQHFSDGLDVPGDLIIPKAHVDSAIPKPADIDVNLGIVPSEVLLPAHSCAYLRTGEEKANPLKSRAGGMFDCQRVGAGA